LPEDNHGRKEIRQSERARAYAGAGEQTQAGAEVKQYIKNRGECRGQRRSEIKREDRGAQVYEN
jgi:hypothetical protein